MRDWVGAEQSHQRAMELLLNRTTAERYALMLTESGRTSEAQKQYGIAVAQEPLGGRPPLLAWHAYLAQGRLEEAKGVSNWQSPADQIENNLDMAFNEADPGKLKAAIRALPQAIRDLPHTLVAITALYGPVLDEFDSPERVLEILHKVYRDEDQKWIRKLHDLAMLAVYFGDPQFALKLKEEEFRLNIFRLKALWYPVMSEARRLPEFKELATKLNLVEYWHAYGWADYCRPLGDDDFECF